MNLVHRRTVAYLLALVVHTSLFAALAAEPAVVAWAKGVSRENDVQPTAVAAFPDKSMIVAGQFSGSDRALFTDASRLSSAGGKDIFVAKLSEAGSVVWLKAVGGTGNDAASAVATHTDGSSVVVGYYAPQGATFGTLPPLSSVGSYQGFAAKFGQLGEALCFGLV